jgi:O-antigen/teichoic acid export membrane protein
MSRARTGSSSVLALRRFERPPIGVLVLAAALELSTAAAAVRWQGSPTRVLGGIVLAAAVLGLVLRPRSGLFVIAGAWGLIHSYLAAADLGGSVGGASLNLSRGLGAAIVVGLGLSLMTMQHRGAKLPLAMKATLCFLGVFALDAWIAPSHSAGAADLVRVASGILVGVTAYYVFDSLEHLLKLTRVVSLCGIAVGLMTILQFAAVRVVPGIAAKIFGSAYTYSFNANGTAAAVRVYGPLGGPGETAGFLLVAVAFALVRYTLLRDRGDTRRIALGIGVMSVAILATLTRSSAFAVIVLLVLWSLQRQVRSLSASGVRIKIFLLLVLAVLAAVPLLGSQAVQARLWDLNLNTSGGNFAQGRARIWSTAYDQLRHSSVSQLLFGHGAHSSYVTITRAAMVPTEVSPHNLLIWLALESGLFGSILYLAFLFAIGRTYFRTRSAHRYAWQGQTAAVAFAALLAYQLQGLFTLSPTSVGHGLYFMLFVGATLRACSLRTDHAQPVVEKGAVAPAVAIPPAPVTVPHAPALPPVPHREYPPVPSGASVVFAPAAGTARRRRSMWTRLGHDTAIFASSAIAMALLQAAFRIVAIHDLRIADYGKAGLLIGIFNVAASVGAFGIPAATARLASRTEGFERGTELVRAAMTAAAFPATVTAVGFGAATYVITHSAWIAAASAAGVPPMVLGVVIAGFVRGKGFVWRAAAVQPANAIAQLAALVALSLFVHVTVGWVLASFYIGNVVALLVALVFLRSWLEGRHRGAGRVDPEAGVRSILRFSVWLSFSNLAIMGLTLLPRIALVHVSYTDVAFFDLALLIYSIPQRLTASLVIALIPTAAAREARGETVTVPARSDALFVTAVFAAVDAVLWRTHALPELLRAVGLGKYTPAEHILLIVLLAAPAELFFSINSGLLQAFGKSRRLAAMTLSVLAVSSVLAPVCVHFGSTWLAALLAVDYWMLFMLSSRFTGVQTVRRSMLSPLLARATRA